MNRIEKTLLFVEEALVGLDSAHGIKHAIITANFAKFIAEEEKADVEQCVIVALLHDIGRNKEGKWKKETINDNHGVDSAKSAKSFLLSLGFSENKVHEITLAISQHCFPNIQSNKISEILWDSDKLNMFSKEMKLEYVKYWKTKGWTSQEIAEQIQKEREFYLKTFHTETARRIAKENFLI